MSLFFDLRVTTGNGSPSLGLLEVQRTSHTDEPNPGERTFCTYTVRLDGRDVGSVQHRYGDPPWALIGKASNAVWAHQEMAAQTVPRERIHAAQLVDAMGKVDGTRLVQRAIEAAKAELDAGG